MKKILKYEGIKSGFSRPPQKRFTLLTIEKATALLLQLHIFKKGLPVVFWHSKVNILIFKGVSYFLAIEGLFS